MRTHELPAFFWALRPYRASFSVGIIASVSNKILDLMPPLLVAWVIDTVQGNTPFGFHVFYPITLHGPSPYFYRCWVHLFSFLKVLLNGSISGNFKRLHNMFNTTFAAMYTHIYNTMTWYF